MTHIIISLTHLGGMGFQDSPLVSLTNDVIPGSVVMGCSWSEVDWLPPY